MNGTDILAAVGGLDEELVESAAVPRRRLKRGRTLAVAAAIGAVMVLAAGFVIAKNLPLFRPQGENSVIEPEDGEQHMSYISVLKYRGGVYRFYSYTRGASGVSGKKLGTIENIIPPGSDPAGYPDLSGSIGGDIYEAEGFDPAYVVCMKDDSGVSYYVGGGEARYGREVLEDRLHVSERFVFLIYEGSESLFNGYEERFALDGEMKSEALETIAALDDGEFVSIDDEGELLSILARRKWRLTVDIGGLSVDITLCGGGYAAVSAYGGGAYLRFDESRIARFEELLASGKYGTPIPSEDSVIALRAERLHDVPTFGRYFPKDAPAGYAVENVFLLYRTDEETGEVLRDEPAMLTVDYRGEDDFDKLIVIRVRSAADLAEELRGVDLSRRSDAHIDAIAPADVRNEAPEHPEIYEATAYDDDIAVTVYTSSSLSPEEIVALLRECFGK